MALPLKVLSAYGGITQTTLLPDLPPDQPLEYFQDEPEFPILLVDPVIRSDGLAAQGAVGLRRDHADDALAGPSAGPAAGVLPGRAGVPDPVGGPGDQIGWPCRSRCCRPTAGSRRRRSCRTFRRTSRWSTSRTSRSSRSCWWTR